MSRINSLRELRREISDLKTSSTHQKEKIKNSFSHLKEDLNPINLVSSFIPHFTSKIIINTVLKRFMSLFKKKG
jgi:hypothetical protein